ncbi:ATP-binding protein [Geodermatophilus sp. SYSU D01105]
MDLLERDGPIRSLTAACDRAARGRGGVVLVTGEPGIGKTALATAFADRLLGGRVLLGRCDDLATPRPLGPLRDLAGAVGGPLSRSLAEGAPPSEVHDRLLGELAAPPHPTVLVLEDVHWADDATVDVITTVGRRIAGLPAVLVLTYRDGDLPAGHALHRAVAGLPTPAVTRLPLAPLSPEAVAVLVGEGAERVHAVTGGNPFYVTELLDAPRGELPPSVAAAVAGRVASLDPAARHLVELVSVVPSRMDAGLLDTVLPGWPAAAEQPEQRGLLQVGPGHVAFRHELTRQAVLGALSGAARRRRHAEVLAGLLRRGADPADLVHHAEAAGDGEVLAAWALPAARHAAAQESSREAYAHYRRAGRFAGRLPDPERARVWEEASSAAYRVGRIPEALTAVDDAAAAFGAAGDRAGVGRCARLRSRLHWYAGEGDAARREARRAVEVLEPLGESPELAAACSSLSQLAMLADDHAECRSWGRRAAEMAQRVGDPATYAHARVNIGVTEAYEDPDATATLEEAHRAADACGERHEAVRALVNAAWAQLLWVRPDEARRLAERAREYATAHEVDQLGAYLDVTIAWLRARAGEWEAAARVAGAAVGAEATVTRLLAATVLAEVAVRRGDADAAARLADVAARADRTGELQRIEPVLELEVEHALLTGGPLPVGRIARAVTLAWETGCTRWGGGRLAAWAAVAGYPVDVDGPAAAPHAAVLAGDWAAAADAFGAIGWPYDRALASSFLDDPTALAEALETARALGAAPLAAHVGRRMRALGHPVPHGRRTSTRTNPAGLTARQVEVLRLLAEGLTNTEIADRLVVSPRTAEHHVEAVLAKLAVPTRRDAARQAAALGLLSS